jgi:general secretion pathway protein A
MYWEHFGFKEPPFALTPNPAFLFLSSPHQEAFAHLLFAIENRAGFIELSGEVGTGKTTIIRTLLNQLEPETYRTALIFNPTLSPLGLFREINAEFGLPAAATDLQELHQALNAFLLEENRAGTTVVLVIDEAQNLSVEVLEQLRLISNLETETSKLIQIVLVGQPELRALLSRPELRQLDQRITVRYHLKPMDFQDACDYIRHRIRFAAGGGEPLVFSSGAAKKIFSFSGGLPRLVNIACDRALLLAYTRETREVSAAMATECLSELRREQPQHGFGLFLKVVAAVVAATALAGAGWWLFEGHAEAPGAKSKPLTVAAKAVAVTPATGQAAAGTVPSDGQLAGSNADTAAVSLSREALLKGLADVSEGDNRLGAVNAVLSAWHSTPLDAPQGGSDLVALARLRGMQAIRIAGGLDALARLDAPALVLVTLPKGGTRMVALTAIDKDHVHIAPAPAGHVTMTKSELAPVVGSGATVFWKDFLGLSVLAKAADATAVKQLQGLLKGAGCYEGALVGSFGPRTIRAVSEFQRREGLPVDGKAQGVTLMLLYRRAGGFFPPTLQHQAAGRDTDRQQKASPVPQGGAQ